MQTDKNVRIFSKQNKNAKRRLRELITRNVIIFKTKVMQRGATARFGGSGPAVKGPVRRLRTGPAVRSYTIPKLATSQRRFGPPAVTKQPNFERLPISIH